MVEDVDGNVFLDCAAGIAVNSTGHSHPDVVAGDRRAGAEVPAHVGHRLLLRAAGAAGGGAGRRSCRSTAACDRSSATPAPRRSKRHQAGALSRPGGRTSSRSSARSTAGRMGALSLTASKAIQRRGFGPLHAGRVSRAVSRSLSPPLGTTPRRCAAACVDFIEQQLFVAPRVARRSRRDRRRADPGRRRLHRRARRVPAAAARADDEARHPAGRRRSAVGHGADRARCSRSSTSASSPTSMAIAKGIASGLPLGVAAARAGLMAWPPGAHASTFGGNPVSCAAALATIALLQDQLVANAADVGAHLMAGLKALADEASADRRRARPRPDDRRRAGARSADEGARDDGARRGGRRPRSAAACWCSAPARTRSASRRRWC